MVAKEKFKIDMEWNKRKMAWKVSEKSGVVITGCFIWEEESSCFRVMLNRQGKSHTNIYIENKLSNLLDGYCSNN